MSAPFVPAPAARTLGSVAVVWWPLALSWLLMGVEQPLISAVVARLASPETNLAAYGGVVFPIALVIEAPVIMLLAASTELSRDREAYRALGRFTHRLGAILTCLHLLVVATPLFDVLVGDLLGVPLQARPDARIGLWCMLPWTWAIASRRFHQGALIRFGFARAVTKGTGIRLLASATVLAVGYFGDVAPGVAVGACALSAGVLAEATYASYRVRPVVRGPIELAPLRGPVLRGRAFLAFYVPLAMMPIVALVVLPLGTAALSRMPAALPSLAVWPMVSSILFVLQTFGLAFNEVVVAQLDDPDARPVLWRFTILLVAASTLALTVMSLPPVASRWFSVVAGLPPGLTERAVSVLWIGIPIPAMRALQSWYQGQLVHARRTRAISEAVAVFAIVDVGILVSGVLGRWGSGLQVALVAFASARVLQTVWLVLRARQVLRAR
jgi:hypothetical protein